MLATTNNDDDDNKRKQEEKRKKSDVPHPNYYIGFKVYVIPTASKRLCRKM